MRSKFMIGAVTIAFASTIPDHLWAHPGHRPVGADSAAGAVHFLFGIDVGAVVIAVVFGLALLGGFRFFARSAVARQLGASSHP